MVHPIVGPVPECTLFLLSWRIRIGRSNPFGDQDSSPVRGQVSHGGSNDE